MGRSGQGDAGANSLQIIGGKFRGKRLQSLRTGETRPTMNRVRESVFNVLESGGKVRDAVVLDLFAGTGANGLECISRGAEVVVMNDLDATAFRVIQKNVGSLKLGQELANDCIEISNSSYKILLSSLRPDVRVFNCDYKVLLVNLRSGISSGMHPKFDLVFLDAPYDSDLGIAAAHFLLENDMLSPDGVIVLESDKKSEIPIININNSSVRHEVYGRSRITFLTKNQN